MSKESKAYDESVRVKSDLIIARSLRLVELSKLHDKHLREFAKECKRLRRKLKRIS